MPPKPKAPHRPKEFRAAVTALLGGTVIDPSQLASATERFGFLLVDDLRRRPAVASVRLPALKARFFAWLDAGAAGAPRRKVKAFNLCLYEGADYFEADFFGCPAYDPKDPDWACRWCHEGPSRFVFSSDAIAPEWAAGLRQAKKFVREYLASEQPGAAILRRARAVTVGFSDGDLDVVWPGPKRAPGRR
ncbi:MAG TPA: hypothetical protein VEB66_13450 [Opitutaceae bacterium]|nr:hypothetical protein [Opitutaceae bacterium]